MPTIAASSYSFWRLFKSGTFDLAQDAARLAREAGADAIEFALGPPLSHPLDESLARQLLVACEREHLPICSVVVSAELYRGDKDDRQEAVRSVVAQLESACMMGAARFRHDATLGPENGDLSDAAFRKALPIVAESCRVIAEHAARLGIRSSIENHGLFMQHADRVKALVGAVDHPSFGVTLDIGNSLFADQNHLHAVRTLAPYAITVHVKDFVVNPTKETAPGPYEDRDVWPTWPGGPRVLGCTLGDGNVDVEGCVRGLLESGFDGPFSVEFEGPWPDPREAMRSGIAKLRSVLESASTESC